MSDFQRIASQAVDDLLELDPEQATGLGDHRFDSQLNDRSLEGAAAASSRLAQRRRQLAEIDLAQLDREAAVDAAILMGELDRQIFSYDQLHELAWNPLAYNPGDALEPLLNRETIPMPDRLRALAARLRQLPALVDLARQQLENPPQVHVETAIQQHPGIVALIRDEVGRFADQAGESALVSELRAAQELALEAWADFGTFLEETLPRASGNFRLGPELFSRKLEVTLQSPLTPQEALRRAWAHLEQVTEELARASRDFLEGRQHIPAPAAIRAALDEVAQDRPTNDTVVGEASRILREATHAVRELGLATIPDDPFEIEVMPEFRRGVATAYCIPAGPFEEGAHSKVAIAPTPSDWSPERVASFYRENNLAMITDLVIHEAMPGHVLQLAHARRFQGPTSVRAVFWNGPFVEGWACHAERLMAERGYGGVPVRLQQLKMQLRFAINAILDAEVHSGEMSEAEAVALMTGRGFQEEAEARSKWRRAALTSAQLSTYFVGYAELDDLFAQLGRPLSYDQVLSHGSPPTRELARLLAVEGDGTGALET